MVRGHLGEEPDHDRLEREPQPVYEPGAVGEPHQAEPQHHDGEKFRRKAERGAGRLDRLVANLLQVAGHAAEQHGQDDQPQPDEVQHEPFCRGAARVSSIGPSPAGAKRYRTALSAKSRPGRSISQLISGDAM